MNAWIEWYEGKFADMFGDTEPGRSAGRALFYLTFATWTFPFYAAVFAVQEAVDDVLSRMFPQESAGNSLVAPEEEGL